MYEGGRRGTKRTFEEYDAREEKKRLENKFEPKKVPNRIRLKKEIHNLKLKYGLILGSKLLQ